MTDEAPPAPPPLPSAALLADTVGRAQHAGLTPTEARSFALADRLIAQGVNPDRVRAAMPEDTVWAPDTRSPQQIQHDRAHNIAPYVSGQNYFYAPPVGGLGPDYTPEATAKFDVAMRELSSNLQMPVGQGSTFIKSIADRISQGNRASPDQLAVTLERTEATLKSVYGAKYDALAASIHGLLDTYAGGLPEGLVRALRPGGSLCSPNVFATLANRAARLAAWRSSRPE